ncbi:unnamed protein product [Mytilus coruscus]|uniref:Ig-like domain-containing protein n=1 Tax=Mytilus coruscus TaxID=42192 RepID=A0A6J8E407_MYTCO|nr:unnamed protein product [Mytilus coruscus]
MEARNENGFNLLLTTTSKSTQDQDSLSNVDQNDETYYICYATNTVGTGQSQQTYVDVIGSPPEISIQSNSYSVLLGQTVTFVCTISANPNATSVQWYKVINGVQSSLASNAGKYNTPTVSSPNLVINSAAQSDTGYYVCTATNIVGTGTSSQTYLTVTGSIPTLVIGSDYYPVNYGNTATIECNVDATPKATSISWQKIQNGVSSPVDISGRYQGAVPYVQVLSNYYSVEIGLTVTLQCTVTSNPSHTNVTWNKIVNGQQTNIGSNSRYSGGSTNTPSLTISNAVDSDEGYYICTAVNAVGEGQSSQTYLDVIGNVPSVTVGQGYNVVLGNSITMTCTVFATPSTTIVQWNRITNNVHVAINVASNPTKYSGASVSTPSLTISNCVEGDEGYYTCQATNSVGTAAGK